MWWPNCRKREGERHREMDRRTEIDIERQTETENGERYGETCMRARRHIQNIQMNEERLKKQRETRADRGREWRQRQRQTVR